jgi:hypothetical protein
MTPRATGYLCFTSAAHPHLQMDTLQKNSCKYTVSFHFYFSRRYVGRTSTHAKDIGNQTTIGHIANNELDTHADTCCAGANWSLMELTGKIGDVNPL